MNKIAISMLVVAEFLNAINYFLTSFFHFELTNFTGKHSQNSMFSRYLKQFFSLFDYVNNLTYISFIGSSLFSIFNDFLFISLKFLFLII